MITNQAITTTASTTEERKVIQRHYNSCIRWIDCRIFGFDRIFRWLLAFFFVHWTVFWDMDQNGKANFEFSPVDYFIKSVYAVVHTGKWMLSGQRTLSILNTNWTGTEWFFLHCTIHFFVILFDWTLSFDLMCYKKRYFCRCCPS